MRWVVYRMAGRSAEYLRDLDGPGRSPRTTTDPTKALQLTMSVAIVIANDLTRTKTPYPWKVKATTCPAT